MPVPKGSQSISLTHDLGIAHGAGLPAVLLPVGPDLDKRYAMPAGKAGGQLICPSGSSSNDGFDVGHAERPEQTLLQPCVIAERARTCHRKLHLIPKRPLLTEQAVLSAYVTAFSAARPLDFSAQQGNNSADGIMPRDAT